MPADAATSTAGAPAGVRLSLPLGGAGLADEITLEAGHVEWICRMAVANAVRAGDLGADQSVAAVLRRGQTRGQHGEVSCLESFAVDLFDENGVRQSVQEFPRVAFATPGRAHAHSPGRLCTAAHSHVLPKPKR